MTTLSFPWPSHKEKTAIMPVFLPFAGCPSRCIYCAQNLQTAEEGLNGSLSGGSSSGSSSIEKRLAAAHAMLEERAVQGRGPCELAFYGGTFTAQREEHFTYCLSCAEEWLAQGLIDRWRCSTRPDSLSSERLRLMRDAGCTCIELGIQSFSDEVLKTSNRGYTAQVAQEGLQKVLKAGFALGVQLLPGLPESTVSGFLSDVEKSLASGCSLLRFYPCLVVRSTVLAKMFERGEFVPMDTRTAVMALAEGLLLANAQSIPVTRIGVAYEQEFEQHVLAGPRDLAMGTRVRSYALSLALKRSLPEGAVIQQVFLPAKSQGYCFGHRGENRPFLSKLGVHPGIIRWHDRDEVVLEFQ